MFVNGSLRGMGLVLSVGRGVAGEVLLQLSAALQRLRAATVASDLSNIRQSQESVNRFV